MNLILLKLFRRSRPLSSPWLDVAPVREELFGVERLEQHAESLASAQSTTTLPPDVMSLQRRIDENSNVLLAAYRAIAAVLEKGGNVVPAAEWLLDNYHVIEEQIREIRDDLPAGYYRQLPKLAEGPFAGYPRVFGIAWAYVAHTDSHFDPDILCRFIAAYQRVQPLTIGELWAVAITLRIVLIENLRRLVDQINKGRAARADADALAARLMEPGCAASALALDITARPSGPLSEAFAAQLAKRLRGQDPKTMPALGWLEDRLAAQGIAIDGVVQLEQQRQGASNLTVRNIIISMRLISDVDWADLFERVSLVDHRLRAASNFSAMDFPTRNLYRSAIEQLARRSSFSEFEVAGQALEASRRAVAEAINARETHRLGDPGYYLIDRGRSLLEEAIGFKPSYSLRIRRFIVRQGIGGYVGSILIVTAALLVLAVWMLSGPAAGGVRLGVFVLIAFLPITGAATALIDRIVTTGFGATTLPGLELSAGVPRSFRTLVAVPMLMTNEDDLLEQIEGLEVHHLAGASGDLVFALLADGVDADEEVLEGDMRLLISADKAIKELNERYGPGPGGDRFIFLYRRRIFNAGENTWMGWERKRGKLHELNRLLRGATDTTFMSTGERPLNVPKEVRFVITLDADTRLPRDAARRMIGKMAHPLNRPKYCAVKQRIVEGYGILQPRVTPTLSDRGEGSLYQRIFSSPGGMDPYAAAVSDVYQDLFGEGSYVGKGIYDIDAFEAVLSGRIPENALLSHDLFEGIFARAGLVSDIEIFEDFPSRYDVAAKREHRWARGDWQLLPWIFGKWHGVDAVPFVGRGKMLDNLRRSLLGPSTLLAFAYCWLLPLSSAIMESLFFLGVIAISSFLPIFFSVMPPRLSTSIRKHFWMLLTDMRMAVVQTFFSLAFLGDQAARMIDAILRTLGRLFITRHHLLEWTTAAETQNRPRLSLLGSYQQMSKGVALPLLLAISAFVYEPRSIAFIMPFICVWLFAPALAYWISRPSRVANHLKLSDSEARDLRLIARNTWRYFETFVTPEDNMLPPDNFQEDPKPVIAHRTSPTNIGLYLLSAIAARDFGWVGTIETLERIEKTFATLDKLERFKGHFFNWYETESLQTLEPAYVSSVDSGNLAGDLIVLSQACEEWADALIAPSAVEGLKDGLQLAREQLAVMPVQSAVYGGQLASLFEKIEGLLKSGQLLKTLSPKLNEIGAEANRLALEMSVETDDPDIIDLVFWVEAFKRTLREHDRDRQEALESPSDDLSRRLKVLAYRARNLAIEMDFAFLLDPDRQLLSIGYSMLDQNLDLNCYDLLASEARLASLFAIAKGDIATKHWFHLGRAATPIGNGSALISWSGSMFEYLMPSLVMQAPVGSLLQQTNRMVVKRQQSYGRSLKIPWGISESAYNARDMEFTYQYSNFGVPGLGLKRGLSENVVIAPYATGLATMIDPHGACENYSHLAQMGARGRYGFYEALDFTRSRLPEGKTVVIVRNFMAHHQGMTIVAIANCLHDGLMRTRFHSEPIIQASELLLQERMTRSIAIAHPQAEEVATSPVDVSVKAATERRFSALTVGAPVTHLLSNGCYSVMLTTSGAGYSRWRDVAVTRWKEDATRDNWGYFILLRDMETGKKWSAGSQPINDNSDHSEIIFDEDRAEFIRHDGPLTTIMDVIVSGEDDGEVRRVSVTNSGRYSKEIDLTSYAELALSTPATDAAHPAFSKMFVVTEILSDCGALVATRRRRSPDEPEVWAAHFSIVEGEIIADPQFESDRAKFLGRSGTISDADAMQEGRELTNTVGTVLDPIFSIRQTVRIAPGGVARIAFWTVVASTREMLLDLIDKHHDRSAFERAQTLAWTQAQVQLRHLDIGSSEAAEFQYLASPILYSDSRFRASADAIVRGAGKQSGLWPLTVSGDLPIVLLRIDDVQDMAQVSQLLRAHEYWGMKQLSVDLVIVNEHPTSYLQELQIAIDSAVRSSQSRSRFGKGAQKGAVYALRADLMTAEARALLQSVARVVLVARFGTISQQIARLPESSIRSSLSVNPKYPKPSQQPSTLDLEFFNGLGGFDKGAREYVVVLHGKAVTPAPWINVIANREFGFQVSEEGSGYTWAENSRENQLTPWSNDPVEDPAGEAIYLRDEDSGEIWSPTAQPIRDGGTYIARHGFGYSQFEHQASGIASELLQYVPLADPIKISRLTLRNRSGKPRRISVTSYAEWVTGTSRSVSGPFISTWIDEITGAMLVCNPWSTAFPGRVAFMDLNGKQSAWTADRTEFLGRNGSSSAPAALVENIPLSGAVGAGLDPCAALQCIVEIGAGETIELVSFIGQGQSLSDARTTIAKYRSIDLNAVLDEVKVYWKDALGAIQVTTPDRAMDIMLNGWLLYQTLACRISARAAFYQASGAYGFRDQLQDGMALTFAQPQETRQHILRAASRQFVEGDVQHWWLPHTGQGVRTRISDDRVWLAFATATYIECSGDATILDEVVPFLEGPLLGAGEHDAFFQPMMSDEKGSLFEHCARGIEQCLDFTGELGLPLIGTGDWNDGLSRVGQEGKGESVWLGWLLLRTIEMFTPFADSRDDARAQRWRDHAKALQQALEDKAWDGEWYRRATYDDGTWLGSKSSEECQIDSIAQSWSVLSEAGDCKHAATAMASLEENLIRPNDGIAPLFWPPFDKTPKDPGYIIGYPPGLRENGGQYSHAAMWAVLAFTKLGQAQQAVDLFALVNPINHARTRSDVQRYKVEPYVIAADIYSVAPHVGRGGWTWYTGSAGWMYRAGIEGILGIRREGNVLIVKPTIPSTWPGFEAVVKIGATQYDIRVENTSYGKDRRMKALLDEQDLDAVDDGVRVSLDGMRHRLAIFC